MNGSYINDCATCSVVDIPNSGKPLQYIVYINLPGHRPIIKFNGWGGFSVKNKSYIKIQGFEIVGNNANVTLSKALRQPQSCANKKGTLDPRYNGNGITISERSHHVIIAGNIIRDCGGGGIGANHSDYITVEDNIVYNTSLYSIFGNSGISFYQFWNSTPGAGYRNVIRRNKTFNNKSLVPWKNSCLYEDGNGIIVDDFRNKQNGSKLGAYKGRTLIENNISWHNGGTGIHTFQSDHVDIINNTAYCNSQGKGLKAGQILSGLGNDNKIINNILVSNASIPINTNYSNTNLIYENNLHYNINNPVKGLVAINTLSAVNDLDPQFVKASFLLDADFRLQSNSPAINRAHAVFYSNSDFFKYRRPKDNAPDIGAVEYLVEK
jgi:parallel beta-helix repeat protein